MNDNLNKAFEEEINNENELQVKLQKLKDVSVTENSIEGKKHLELLSMIEKCMTLMNKISEVSSAKLKIEEESLIIDLLNIFPILKIIVLN